jgi:hypothetical protein
MPLHWTIPTETAEAPAYPLSETQRTALAVLLSPIIEEVAGSSRPGSATDWPRTTCWSSSSRPGSWRSSWKWSASSRSASMR